MDCNLIESYRLLTILVVMVTIIFRKKQITNKTSRISKKEISLNYVADNYINNLCTKFGVNSWNTLREIWGVNKITPKKAIFRKNALKTQVLSKCHL